MKVLVSTLSDFRVAVTRPTDSVFRAMTCGGGIVPANGVRLEIDEMVRHWGTDPGLAKRWVHAIAFGGCVTSEAMALFRDKDAPKDASAIEVWDEDEVPTDRWFRNAWRRSPNGGPVGLDLNRAKIQQVQHIDVEARDRRGLALRHGNWDALDFAEEVTASLKKWRRRILGAKEAEEVRSIWPWQDNALASAAH